MVYALSNAGIDVNAVNYKGNTAIHCAYIRGYTEIGFIFIEALLKVGSDLESRNRYNKVPFEYMEQTEQFQSLYDSHAPSIWWAVENSQLDDIYRLMNGIPTNLYIWILVDLKKIAHSLSSQRLSQKNPILFI